MKSPSTRPESMHARIKRIASDPIERLKAISDYSHTFRHIGLSEEEAVQLSQRLLDLLKQDESLLALEAEALRILQSTVCLDQTKAEKPLIEVLDERLANRAEMIFTQIQSYVDQIKGRVLDYGTGDGQVAQLLQDRLGAQVEGVDIRDYRKPSVTVPFTLLIDGHLQAKESNYAGAILTNVLHHEADNERILKDLSEAVVKGGWIIILETVPAGETEEEMEADKDRTFANDYLYNRLFHNADIPVPGSFETVLGWKERFIAHGMTVLFEQNLGFDQATIRDRHYLYILEV